MLAVIQFAMDTDAGHCTETLSEFDRMDFVPLGCVKPDFYKGRVAYSVAPSETFLQYEERKKGSVVQLSTSLAPRSGDIGAPQLHVFQDFRRENVQQIPDAIRRSGAATHFRSQHMGHFRDETYDTMIFFCILSP